MSIYVLLYALVLILFRYIRLEKEDRANYTLFAGFLSSYYIYYMSIFKHIFMSHPVPKNVVGIF